MTQNLNPETPRKRSRLFFRSWLQFRIRTLLIVMTVVSVAFAAYTYERRKVIANWAMMERINQLGGSYSTGEIEDVVIGYGGTPTLAKPTKPFSIRRAIGLEPPRLLNCVWFQDSKLTDADLRAVASAFERCALLDFSGTMITDQGLSYLPKGGGLFALTLDGTKVTGKFLETYQCDIFYSLSLHNTQVDDEGVKCLASFQAWEVDLGRTRITDRSGELLAKVEGLQSVDVHENPLTERFLEAVLKSPTLGGLDISYTQMSEDALSLISKHSKLGSLGFSGIQVTEKGTKELAKISSLRSLTLCDSGLNDADMQFLLGNLQLEELDISDTKVTLAGLKAFLEGWQATLPARQSVCLGRWNECGTIMDPEPQITLVVKHLDIPANQSALDSLRQVQGVKIRSTFN